MSQSLRKELERQRENDSDERPKKRVKRERTSFHEEMGRLHGFQLASWLNTLSSGRNDLIREAESLLMAKKNGMMTTTAWISSSSKSRCALEAFALQVCCRFLFPNMSP